MDAAFLQSLWPADAGVRITAVAVDPTAVAVRLATTGGAAPRPRCRSASTAVHGRYRRTLCDRSGLGRPVRLGDPDLRNLAHSVLSDAAAVQGAMTGPRSNGQGRARSAD